jgi:hypothetical protein
MLALPPSVPLVVKTGPVLNELSVKNMGAYSVSVAPGGDESIVGALSVADTPGFTATMVAPSGKACRPVEAPRANTPMPTSLGVKGPLRVVEPVVHVTFWTELGGVG